MENVTKTKKHPKSFKESSRETKIGSILLSLTTLMYCAVQLWVKSPDIQGYFVFLGLIPAGIAGYYLYLGRFEDVKKTQ